MRHDARPMPSSSNTMPRIERMGGDGTGATKSHNVPVQGR
jgi:hypothetical protein